MHMRSPGSSRLHTGRRKISARTDEARESKSVMKTMMIGQRFSGDCLGLGYEFKGGFTHASRIYLEKGSAFSERRRTNRGCYKASIKIFLVDQAWPVSSSASSSTHWMHAICPSDTIRVVDCWKVRKKMYHKVQKSLNKLMRRNGGMIRNYISFQ